MNVGLLKHGCPVTASWRLKKMCKVSILSFHAGIAGDRLRVPYFLPPHLTEAVYQDSLRNVLLELLGDMDLQTRIHLWFMHDGVHPHFVLAVWESLNMFSKQWIGWGGPTAWPDRPLDLNPLDFYLWGNLKSSVCHTEVSDMQDLQHLIQNWFLMMCVKPRIL